MTSTQSCLRIEYSYNYAENVIIPIILLRSNHKIKVFIADDSFIVREHLVTMFDELAGVEVVGQAEFDQIPKLLEQFWSGEG